MSSVWCGTHEDERLIPRPPVGPQSYFARHLSATCFEQDKSQQLSCSHLIHTRSTRGAFLRPSDPVPLGVISENCTVWGAHHSLPGAARTLERSVPDILLLLLAFEVNRARSTLVLADHHWHTKRPRDHHLVRSLSVVAYFTSFFACSAADGMTPDGMPEVKAGVVLVLRQASHSFDTSP